MEYIVVPNACATHAVDLRVEWAEALFEELLILQVLGGDRELDQAYVAGNKMNR